MPIILKDVSKKIAGATRIIFVLAIMFFASLGIVSAEEPQVEIKDVEIQKNADSITINATLFNPSQDTETSPFTYLATIRTINHFIPSSDPELDLPSLIVSAVEGEEYFTLKPKEEKRVSYLIPTSPHLPKDNYELILSLILKDGQSVGYNYDILYDYGLNPKEQKGQYEEGFLAFDQESCAVIRPDGLSFPANEGPIFEPNQEPIVRCKVKNIGDTEVKAYPVTIWKEFFVYGRPSSGQRSYEKDDQFITFRAGETKTIEVLLPAEEVPQVYQALVSFEDENGIKKSFDMFFRWTIKGQSGRVHSVSLADEPKISYKKGETINLSVDYYGSMDMYWRGIEESVSGTDEFSMKAVIKDGNGEVCGESEAKLPPVEDGSLKNQIINVELSKNCSDIAYSVTLSSVDGNIIAQEENKLPVKSKQGWDMITYLYLFGGIILFVILILLFMKTKKRKVIGNVFFLAIVAASASFLFLANEVEGKTKSYTGSESVDYGGEAFTTDSNPSNKSDELHASYEVKSGYTNKIRIKNVYAYFQDYLDGKVENPSVHFDYNAGFNQGCGNSTQHIKVVMDLKVGGATYDLMLRKKGSSDNFLGKYTKKTYDSYDDRNMNLEILADGFFGLDGLYDGNGKLNDNPELIIKITYVSQHATRSMSEEKYFRSTFNDNVDLTVYSYTSDALDDSDTIKVIIPLSNLKNPLVTLDASPTSVEYEGNTTLTWTTADVDSCVLKSNDVVQPGGVNKTLSSSELSAGSVTLTGLQSYKHYELTCSAYLGSAVGTKNYSDTVEVNVGEKPTEQDQCGTTNNDCISGTWSDLIDRSEYKWKCGSLTCTAPITTEVIEPICGSSKNTCDSGFAQDVDDSSTEYKWQCNGSGGGGSIPCTAPINGGGGGGGCPACSGDPTTYYTLTVSIDGTGEGVVSGNGINCSTNDTNGCSVSIAQGTSVSLAADPGSNSEFSTWVNIGGVCDGSSSDECTFVMNSETSLTATFNCNSNTCNPDPYEPVPEPTGCPGCTTNPTICPDGTEDTGDGCGSSGGGPVDGVCSTTSNYDCAYGGYEPIADADDKWQCRGLEGGDDKECLWNADLDGVTGGLEPVPESGTISLSVDANESLSATIIDGLQADSNEITITNTGSCTSNITLSATLPSGLSATIVTDGKSKLSIKSISGETTAGDYTVTVEGEATDCTSGTLPVTLTVEKITTRWEEF